MSIQHQKICRWVAHNFMLLILAGGIATSMLGYFKETIDKQEQAMMFREATRGANAGRWYYDIQKDKLLWDETMFQVFGKEFDTWMPNYQGFNDCLHPSDKKRINDRVMKAIEDRSGYTATFRTIGDDGHVRYVIAGAVVNRLGSYMTGICIPVSGDVLTDMYQVLPPLLQP